MPRPAPMPDPRPKAATLKDVAELAGVSIKTVSNVVNEYEHVRPEMRRKVQKAIDELNYRPLAAAQFMRRKTSRIITLGIPDLRFAYFAELAQLVIEDARARGYTVMINTHEDGVASEMKTLEGVSVKFSDGIIFNPIKLDFAALRARRDTTPMVLIGEHVPDDLSGLAIDHARVDNVLAVRQAVTHLYSIGCQRVAFLGAEPDVEVSSAVLRLQGYEDAVRARGMVIDSRLVAEGGAWQREDGARIMGKLLDAAPEVDGVMCANDQLALGALRTLRERGIRAGRDISVIGYDDLEDAAYSEPGLTTIAPDKFFLARLALDLLLDRLGGFAGPERIVTAPHTLVMRGSTRVV